ncbi:restriction endonuclease subunit S, partial [Ureaplasma zalophigenitalium]
MSTNKLSKIKTSLFKYPVYSSKTVNEGLLGYYNKYLFENCITWTTDGAGAGYIKYRDEKFFSTNVSGVLLGSPE